MAEIRAKGFIEKSLAILQARENCVVVKLQAPNDLNGHPIEDIEEDIDGVKFRRLHLNFHQENYGERYTWHGFGFNPGLRRLEDYERVGPFVDRVGSSPGTALRREEQIGKIFKEMGFYAVVLVGSQGRGYVRHTGANRHIDDPTLIRINRSLRLWRAKMRRRVSAFSHKS
jgi:hypothetical protein